MAAHSVIVTGATGFAGSHLLAALPEDARVQAWARPEVDLLNRASIDRAIQAASPAVIFHLAGATHVGASFGNPVPALEINALGTHHLLEAVRAHAPRARVVVATSGMIYETSSEAKTEDARAIPQSPYGLSKLAQDRLCIAAASDGIDVVVARPFNHTGPRQDPSFAISGFARQLAEIEAGTRPPIIRVGNLDAERDILDVRDVAGAYLVLAKAGVTGQAYNVCRGRADRIGDLLHKLLGFARVNVEIETDPELLRPVDVPRLAGDNTRLRALGWEPRIDTDTMLRDVLSFWRTKAGLR